MDVMSNDCEAAFEEAQRVDMESFRDYDRETFRAGHDPDALTVFSGGGGVVKGIDAIMEALDEHFTKREAIWRWEEKFRRIIDCAVGIITYETYYEVPSENFSRRALTTVTYLYRDGKWLAVADQGTRIPD